MQENTQLSPRTRETIDAEVESIITEQYERAQSLLQKHRKALETLAQELLDQETVEGSAVKAAIEAEAGEEKRTVSAAE